MKEAKLSNDAQIKAFSLIELSIVVLVIGILVAGITQASRLVKKNQLQSARNLTLSSPVSGIADLMLWYETSLESSFLSTEGVDNTEISIWYDNNIQRTQKNNATQASTANKPKFYDGVFGGIPGIRFDGTNDSMGFDGTFFVKTNYTIFVVEQRRASGDRFFIGCTTPAGTHSCLVLGYRSSNTVAQSHYSYDLDSNAFPSYSSPIPRMHTFWFSNIAGKRYWSNGGATYDKNNAQTLPLIANSGANIGSLSGGYNYNGDIAEIIIFTRDLTTEERQAVEYYLSKKYNITITG